MQDLCDEELVDGAARGNESAFVELFSRHGQSVLALIRREVPGAQDREDVLQEALLHAWRDIAKLRNRSRVRPWLLSIARNRCRDHHKSPLRRERPADQCALEHRVGRFGRMAADPAEQSELTDAVRNLQPLQREAIELFYLNGLTIREIARRIVVPAGTVKSRLFHARRDLRRLLDENP